MDSRRAWSVIFLALRQAGQAPYGRCRRAVGLRVSRLRRADAGLAGIDNIGAESGGAVHALKEMGRGESIPCERW